MKSNPLRPMSDTGEAHVMAHFKRPALSRVFLFAAAFAASPVPFFGASNIAKTSGSGATITTGSFGTGTKYTITPDQIKGAAAFNDFAKFNLDAGDVANLEFGAASTLVNVIRDSSASEINGQVNAIKNNKIGGKLIFANANGIIVGSSGAIHAGSIVLMTPTKKFLDGIPGTEDSPGVEGVTAENFDVKFSDLVKIPISSSGTITVSGNLFALDGVKIKAQSITVDGAQILTGQAAVTALGQITNLGDTDAGTALVANSDGTVEILAESVLDEDSAFIWASETVKAEVAIKGTTKIEAKDVTIKANAECYMDPLVTTVSVFTGMGAESESKVDIGKDVTIVAKNGGKVDIAANAAAVLTRFGTDDSVGGTVAEWARRGVDQLNLDPSNQLLSFLKQFIDVNVLYLNSDAKANVDFKGTVETLGVDSASVNINSRAKAKNEFDVLEKTKRGVGFMFAKTNAEAGTLIGETAVINPKGMVSIDSLTESDNLVKMQMGLKSEFSVPSVGEKIYGGLPDQLPVNFNVVIVVSDTNSKASTTVASNAQITGTGVSIVSRALDKQDISGEALIIDRGTATPTGGSGSEEDQKTDLTLTLGFTESNTSAVTTVNGIVKSTDGDIVVDSLSSSYRSVEKIESGDNFSPDNPDNPIKINEKEKLVLGTGKNAIGVKSAVDTEVGLVGLGLGLLVSAASGDPQGIIDTIGGFVTSKFTQSQGAKADKSGISPDKKEDANATKSIDIKLAGTFLLIDQERKASTHIGGKLESAKNIKVTSKVEDFPRMKAGGTSSSSNNTKSADAVVGGAVTYASYIYDANTTVASNAKITAVKDVSITSGTRLYLADFEEFARIYVEEKTTGFGDFCDDMGALFSELMPSSMVYSMATNQKKAGDSDDEAGTISIGGSVNYYDNSITSVTKVDGTVTAGGTLTIGALNKASYLHITGKASLSDDSKVSVGGAFFIGDLDHTVKAIVGDNAILNVNALSVNAENDIAEVVISAAGGKTSSLVAVNGSGSLVWTDNVTEALVSNKAKVNIRDTSKINAHDDFWNVIFAGAVVLSNNGGAGVGASIALNILNRDTTAGISGETSYGEGYFKTGKLEILSKNGGFSSGDALAATVVWTKEEKTDLAGKEGDAKDKAESENARKDEEAAKAKQSGVGNILVSLAAQLGVLEEGSVPETPPDVDAGAADKLSSVGGEVPAGEGEDDKPKFSFALSGSVTVNVADTNSSAVVKNANVSIRTVSDDKAFELKAENESRLYAITGGLSVTKANGESKASGAIAGAISYNQATGENVAQVLDSNVELLSKSPKIDVKATDRSKIFSLGVSAGVASSGESASVTGSVSGAVIINNIATDNTAEIKNLTLTRTVTDRGNGVSVYAENDSEIQAYAASLSVTKSSAGANINVGAEVGINRVFNANRAVIDGLTFNQELASLSAVADNDAFIRAISGAISVTLAEGGQGASVAANYAYNQIGNTGQGLLGILFADNARDYVTEAIIDNVRTNQSNELTVGSLTLSAKTAGEILGIAGSVNLSIGSGGTVAVGAAWLQNAIAADTKTLLGSSAKIKVASDTVISAKNESEIVGVAATIGVAPKAKVGVSGSLIFNHIENVTEAKVAGKLDATAHDVTIEAVDLSLIGSGVGGISVAGNVAVGAALGFNEIYNKTTATIAGANASVTASNIKLHGFTDSEMLSISVGAGVAVQGAGAAVSFASGIVDSETAAVVEGGAKITANTGLQVLAEDLLSINTFAGAVGGGSKGGGAGAVSYNKLNGAVKAFVSGSGTVVTSPVVSIVAKAADSGKNSDAKDRMGEKVDAQLELAVALGSGINSAAVGLALGGIGAGAGSITINVIERDLDAELAGGAKIEGNGTFNVRAQDAVSINSLAGNCVIAGKAAIGAAIAYNAINGHVIAQVTGTGTSVETANAINIFADWTGKVNSVAVGGGAALYATINGSFAFNGVGVDISDAFTSIDFGDINEDYEPVALAGLPKRHIRAVVGDGAIVTASNAALTISATDEAGIWGLIHAKGVSSVAVSGGILYNHIAGSTEALIDTANVTVKSLDMTAASKAIISSTAFTGGVAGVAIGGVLTVNNIDAKRLTRAAILNNAAVEVANAANIVAADDAFIFSLAVNGSVSAGTGVGAAAALNIVGGNVEAFVGDVDDTATSLSAGSLTLTATTAFDEALVNKAIATARGTSVSDDGNDRTIENIFSEDGSWRGGNIYSGSVAGSASGESSYTGALTLNRISRQVISGVGKANVTVTGALAAKATDSSKICSAAGAIGIALNSSISGAVSYNQIQSVTRARIAAASINNITAGSLKLNAESTSAITSAALSGSVGTAFSGAANVSINTLKGTIEAAVSGGNLIVTGGSGDVIVLAEDKSVINTGFITLAASGGAAFGGTLLVNNIETKTVAKIEANALTLNAGSVKVEASSEANITTKGGAAAIGGGVAGSGLVITNNLHSQTIANIGDGANVTAGNSVFVHAKRMGNISLYVGNVAASLAVAIGGTVLVNHVEDETIASITGSSTKVTALGAGSSIGYNSKFGSDIARGVIVSAESDTTLSGKTGGIDVAGGAAVGVNVLAQWLDTSTKALVENASINTGLGEANAEQSVVVFARDMADITDEAAQLSISFTSGSLSGISDNIFIAKEVSALINNATVNAKKHVIVRADSKDVVNASLGAAAVGFAAGAANLTIVDTAAQVKAGVSGTINSGANLEVLASSDTSVKVGALSASGGLVAASGGLGLVTIAGATEAVAAGTLNAKGTLKVSASAKETIDNSLVSAAVGGAAASFAVGVNTIHTATHARIADGALINQDLNYRTLSQDVKVSATDDANITDNYLAGGVGLAAAGASMGIDTIKTSVSATIGNNTCVAAGRHVELVATGAKTLTGSAISGSVGLLAATGAVIIGTLGSDAVDLAKLNSSMTDAFTNGAGSDSNVAALDAKRKTAAKVRDRLGVLSNYSTEASIGTGGTVQAGLSAAGNLKVEAKDTVKANVKVGSNIAGAVSAGAGYGKVNIKNNTNVSLGGTLSATGQISAIAETVDDKSRVDAAVGSVVIAGGGYIHAEINDTSKTTATLQNNTNISSAGSVQINAKQNLVKTVEAGMDSYGIITGGASYASAKTDATTNINIGQGVKIGSESQKVGNVVIGTEGSTYANEANASDVGSGLIAGGGTTARTDTFITSSITVGSNASIYSIGNVRIANHVEGSSKSNATAKTVFAGITVGIVLSRADLKENITVELNSNVKIDAASVNILAKAGDNGNIGAHATASNTADVSFISGASVKANAWHDNCNAAVNIGAGANLNTTGNIDIRSETDRHVKAEATTTSTFSAGGVIYIESNASASNGESSVAVRSNCQITSIGGDVLLKALDNVNVSSYSMLNSNVSGFAAGSPKATATMDNFTTKVLLDDAGQQTQISAENGTVSLLAEHSIKGYCETYLNRDCNLFGISGNVDSTFTYGAKQEVIVGNKVKVKAKDVTIRAETGTIDIYSKAYTYALGLASTAKKATATINGESNSTVEFKSGSEIDATGQLKVFAGNNVVKVETYANARAAGGAGSAYAHSKATLGGMAKIDVKTGAKLSGKNIFLQTDSGTETPDNYVKRLANAESQTVVRMVTETVKKVVCKVTKYVFFGWLWGCKSVVQTVFTWVQDVIGGATNEQILGNGFSEESKILVDGTVSTLASQSIITLEVNSTGEFEKMRGLEASLNGNVVVVRPVKILPSSIEIVARGKNSYAGGDGRVEYKDGVSEVTILNESAHDLKLEGIDLSNSTESPPLQILADSMERSNNRFKPFDNFVQGDTSVSKQTKVVVENTGTAGDIIIAGLITNPSGEITLSTANGNILAMDAYKGEQLTYSRDQNDRYHLEANSLSISAPNGSIGTQGNPLALRSWDFRMEHDSLGIGTLKATAGNDIYLATQAIRECSEMGPECGAVLEIKEITAGGNLQLDTRYGGAITIRQDFMTVVEIEAFEKIYKNVNGGWVYEENMGEHVMRKVLLGSDDYNMYMGLLEQEKTTFMMGDDGAVHEYKTVYDVKVSSPETWAAGHVVSLDPSSKGVYRVTGRVSAGSIHINANEQTLQVDGTMLVGSGIGGATINIDAAGTCTYVLDEVPGIDVGNYSPIAAETSTSVELKDIGGMGSSGSVNIVNVGLLTGTGYIYAYKGKAAYELTNLSAKDIILNTVALSGARGASSVVINGMAQTAGVYNDGELNIGFYGSDKDGFVINSFEQNAVNSSIYLKGSVYAAEKLSLKAGRDILGITAANLISTALQTDFTLEAGRDIGGSENAGGFLRVDLGAAYDFAASGSIALHSISTTKDFILGNITADKVSIWGDKDIFMADGTRKITGDKLFFKAANGGVNVRTEGDSLVADVKNNLTIVEADALVLESVVSQNGNVRILAGGNLSSVEESEDVVQGSDVYLSSSNGAITVRTAAGTITALATGTITLDERDDVTLTQVRSTGGDIAVVANGGINLVTVQTTAQGKSINLEARGGSIHGTGTSTNASTGTLTLYADGDINLKTAVDRITATAAGNIHFDETDGVTLTSVISNADNGSITATAGASILVGQVKTGADGFVSLLSQNGSIRGEGEGTHVSTGALTLVAPSSFIQLNTDVASISAVANGNITVNEENAVSLDIMSTNGSITIVAGDEIRVLRTQTGKAYSTSLTAENGGILGNGNATHVATGALTLSAGGSIQLNTDVASINATAQGDISFAETDTVVLTKVISETGSITLTAGGAVDALELQAEVLAGNVSLTALTGGITAGSITAGGDSGLVSLIATGGAILATGTTEDVNVDAHALLLNAGTDISLETRVDEVSSAGEASGDVALYNDGALAILSPIDYRVGTPWGRGDVTLVADSLDIAGTCVFVKGGLTLVATVGSVTPQCLEAGGNILLDTDGDIATDNITSTGTATSISLRSRSGGITLGPSSIRVAGGQGTAVIDANGDIVSTGQPEPAFVGIVNLSLLSRTGGMNLALDVSQLSATAAGDMIFTNAGAITLENLETTRNGAIQLTAGGDITARRVFSREGGIRLEATTGGITAGALTAISAEPVISPGITLIAGTTDILDDGDESTIVRGGELTLVAHEGRATLVTAIDHLKASTAGDINILEEDFIVLREVRTEKTGNISVVAHGGIDALLVTGLLGIVDLHTTNGEITIGDLRATHDKPIIAKEVRLTTDNGAIHGNGDNLARVVGSSIEISANNGYIKLQTAAEKLSATADRDIIIDELDNISLEGVAATGNGSVRVTAVGHVAAKSVSSEAGSISIHTANGHIYTDNVAVAADQDVSLSTANGSILDDELFGSRITAGSLHLKATDDIHVFTDAGTLSASAGKNITVDENDAITLEKITSSTGDISLRAGGDIIAQEVTAENNGAVALTSTTGSILMGDSGSALLTGGDFTLQALNGDIGVRVSGGTLAAIANGVAIDSLSSLQLTDLSTINDANIRVAGDFLQTGRLSTAGGALNIETAGDFTQQGTIRTNEGALGITTIGDFTQQGSIRTNGGALDIATTGFIQQGAIQTNGGALNIATTSDFTQQGSIQTGGGDSLALVDGEFVQEATAKLNTGTGTISIRTNGDVTLSSLVSENETEDAITVESTGGAILQKVDGATITATSAGARANLIAATGIGGENALLLQVNTLAAETVAGGIQIANDRDLVVELAASKSGDIDLAVNGALGVNTLASGGSVSLVARHISGDTVKAADNVSLKAGDDGIQLVFVDARGVMQAVANGGIRMEALGAGDGPAQVLLQSTRKGANVSIGQAVIRDSLTVAASSADINLKTPNPGYISVTLNGFDGEVPMETIYLSTSGTESLRFATYNVKNGHVRTDATDVAFDDAWADRLELWSAQAYTLLDSYETRRQDAGLQIHSTDGHYSFQLKGQILEAFDGLVVRRMDAVIPGSQPIEDGSALQQSRENNSLQKVSRFFITRNEEGLQGEIREVITENILKWENAHYELQGILDWAPVQRSLPEILYWVPEAKRFPELETNP